MNANCPVARPSRLRSLVGIVLLASETLALPLAFATNDYPFKLMSNATGDVDQVQFDPTQVTVTFTNIPGGGRRAILSIIGGGGGGTQTVLVASNCAALVNLGGNTNAIAVDTNCLYSEGFVMTGDLSTLSNYLANTIAPTNGLATISFVNNLSNYLAGTINNVTNGLAAAVQLGNASNTLVSAINSTNGNTLTALQNASNTLAAATASITNGLAGQILSGGNSGNGSVSSNGSTVTITFPIGASVFGTNSVAGINALVSNVTVAVGGHLGITTTPSSTGGTITISALAPLTNYDSVIFHNFSVATTNDSIGFFYGTDLDTTNGWTNLLYSVATCTSTNVNNGFAYAKLRVPDNVTNLVAIGMHFKVNQAGGGNSNIVLVVSSPLLLASTIYTAQVASVNTDVQTNFPTAGTFLTNNLADDQIDLRWNVSVSTTSINVTAETGLGQNFRWIQQ
ncbi:MAG: hypothetical protein ABSG14_09180 [Verrucomicrobiia bacterium]